MPSAASIRRTFSFGANYGQKVNQDEQTLQERHANLRTGAFKPTSPFGQLIFSANFETFGGIVVLINFMAMTCETHARAVDDDTALQFSSYANRVLLLWYTFECLSRLYFLRKQYFYGSWNVLDFVIVVTGIFNEIMEVTVGANDGGLEQIGMLKSLRMLRLLRLVRLVVAFRELYVLVAGVAKCMKTLFWAVLLIFMVLNAWSILSVEYLRTLVEDLTDEGAYDQCPWCQTAFSNIWLANVTWFQVISGEGWSTLGRPLVDEYFWPFLFFVAGVFIIYWGLLNLIVAAIVDASIAAREEDVASAARIAERQRTDSWLSFQEICKDMDADGSGTISTEEFLEFCAKSEELRQHMTTMGITEKDLDSLLKIIDTDRSGCVEQAEFVDQFTQMKTLVLKTAIFYVLKYAEGNARDMERTRSSLDDLMQEVHTIKLAMGFSVATDNGSSMSRTAAPQEITLPTIPALVVQKEPATAAQQHPQQLAQAQYSTSGGLPTMPSGTMGGKPADSFSNCASDEIATATIQAYKCSNYNVDLDSLCSLQHRLTNVSVEAAETQHGLGEPVQLATIMKEHTRLFHDLTKEKNRLVNYMIRVTDHLEEVRLLTGTIKELVVGTQIESI